MEIRSLRYFLAVAREENMTRAAEQLHVSQSTLSKQIRALEEELGKKLFIRHSFRIELTEEGILLRKRAADLVEMADKISSEFLSIDEITGGEIYFGLAESYQIRHLARVIRSFQERYPDFHYHILSGGTEQVTEKLDKGILDFAVLVEEPDEDKYDYLELPGRDRWGLIFPADDPLAEKEQIRFEDLQGLPLFISEQSRDADLPRWCGPRVSQLTFSGYFQLAYNGSVFAREGLGYLLALDRIVDTSEDSGLVFRPLYPVLENPMYLIWQKYQVFTPIAERFLEEMRDYCDRQES